ncbi:tRNA(Ile)-lysidine synthetase [Desulfocurvibacter africanus PCS]|uniref:tRNA(Ile)-lysidine synthase n=1 Tax=Desulfocurvibacter africanus PCS TaxID=1262666 RepID=M5PWJ3_DESAF|nr:tRNA lysidine(34) synthetase TilS [Desulfocurvibacter africanus]EMG38682.1 tRNA(Ile)-lysidine synthetase [Desulfocurvibacter africanus PCS]
MPPPLRLQDLPPKAARFCLRVERFVRKDLGLDLNGKRLLVALSGGADSTALLYCLRYLAPRMRVDLLAAHVDHGLRPEAGQDAAFCRELCAALGMPLHEAQLDVSGLAKQSGTGIEEAGRQARYDFFQTVLAEQNADLLLTAHHLNDLAEDAIMRLIRGAGWPELAGMPAYDPQRNLLRPLLLTPGTNLREFLTMIGATWREDQSNTDPAFLRNRVRQDILPLFLRENPNFLESMARLWRIAELDRQFFLEFKTKLDIHYEAGRNQFSVPLDALLALHSAMRLRIYKALLDGLAPGQVLWKNLLRLDEAVHARRSGSRVQFPGGKQACLERSVLRFCAVS